MASDEKSWMPGTRPGMTTESIQMASKKLTGSFVALITPFNKDGSVDFVAFRALLKFQEDTARRRC